MKKLVIVFLLLSVFTISMVRAQSEAPLYTALMRYDASIFDQVNGQRVGGIGKGKRVDIYEVLPAWLKVGREGEILGYLKREFLDDYTVQTVSPATTPAYPGIQHSFLAWIKGETSVLASPDTAAEKLIDLTNGCRLALISVEDGFGKLIFRRQYGYIDMRKVSKILPLNLTMDAKVDAPIAAYTSFYNIATNEDNLSRIKNLEVSCEKFAQLRIDSGGNFDFNRDLGPYNKRNGYHPAIVLVDGGSKLGYGGGTCQASSTLYNVVLQLPGIAVTHRRPHGPSGISYLPHGADAAVGNVTQNFKFANRYPFPVRIEGTVQDGALTVAIWRADNYTPPTKGE